MPSWFDHPLSARRDGRSGLDRGRLDADAMPELPRLDEHGRSGHAHRLAQRTELPGLPHRRRGEQQRPDPFYRCLRFAGPSARAGQHPLRDQSEHAGHRTFRFIAFRSATAACNARPATARPMRSFPPLSLTTTCKASRSRATSGSWPSARACHSYDAEHGHGWTARNASDRTRAGFRVTATWPRATRRSARSVTTRTTAAPSFPTLRAARSFSLEEGGTKTFWRGQKSPVTTAITAPAARARRRRHQSSRRASTLWSAAFPVRSDSPRAERLDLPHCRSTDPRHGRPRRQHRDLLRAAWLLRLRFLYLRGDGGDRVRRVEPGDRLRDRW